MKNWFNKYYRTIIISTFLVPIITVAIVTISHVTKWYGISNPFIWGAYLSIGIEIAALSALAAISANMGRNVYFPFGIVTLIQFIGNIYYTYYFIDINGQSFISWVELVSPLIEFIGVESTDLVGHRRFLAVFSGGMLPLISLSFLHMLVKFTEEDRMKYGKLIEKQNDQDFNLINSDELIGEISRVRLSKDDLSRIENLLIKKNQSKNKKRTSKRREKTNSLKTRPKKSLTNNSVELKNNDIVTIDETLEPEIMVEDVNINKLPNNEEIIEDDLEKSQFKENEEEIINQDEENENKESNEMIDSEEKKNTN